MQNVLLIIKYYKIKEELDEDDFKNRTETIYTIIDLLDS